MINSGQFMQQFSHDEAYPVSMFPDLPFYEENHEKQGLKFTVKQSPLSSPNETARPETS